MNYLRISNKGLICAEDLTLIGSSTKREQTGKIGMFGSGWKYALAWLLRNECTPHIYAGHDKINVDFTVKMHRSNPVNVITVDGIETSLTTEMGPKWTGWMALREVLSNAIDEGEHSITTAWSPQFSGEDGNTVIYIPMNGELSEVMMKFDSYFAFNRKENYSFLGTRVFLKKEKSKLNIYRKGIRCHDTSTETLIDFDFGDIDINEDRLCYSWSINYKIQDLIKAEIPSALFKSILAEEKEDYLPESINDNILFNLQQLLKEGYNFTTSSLQKLGGMLFSLPNSLVIPAEWYKKLQDLGLVKSIFEVLGGGKEHFIRTDAKNVSGIEYYLDAFNIKVEIRSGKCESDAFVSNKIAYVKDNTIENDKIIAARIIKRLSVDDLVDMMS